MNSPNAERSSRVRAQPPAAWLVFAAFAAVYLIWGSTYLGIRVAIDSIPPLLMSGARFTLAGLLLYAVMRISGAARPSAVQWRDAGIVGALLLLVGNGGVSWEEKRVPTNMTALIIAVTPLWIILIDWLRPRGARPSKVIFAGMALGFTGVGLIVGSRSVLGHSAVDLVGVSVLLLAALCWALGSVFSRYARRSESALLAVAKQMLTGGGLPLLAGAGVGELRGFELHTVTRTSAYVLPI